MESIGLVEINSIAKGIEAADAMLKAAQVDLLEAKPVCPGKYTILICGDVAAVQSSVDAGKGIAANSVLDDFILPNVHPQVLKAISSTTPITEIIALGIIETFSVASLIVAADTAAKTGQVDLVEIRIGMGIGGKSFVTLTGDVASVESSVAAGAALASERGMLVEKVVIPSPHYNLKQCLC
ncbi:MULTISPECIES: BMC domain-containing protein [Desulfitobacterium]|uniref:Carbon dioxide concentrating mechanism/carboxysome shell protein n=1 Tax=Desulfitobacterium dehalogenans (strain ATCC 51507 / DSM 9161 / JW/IU-DC1) TaxID=756499 RepID=I4A4E2_DESDJ|nr:MULTISPECIES: BMC domain-containing protein [Desulfitobacterium]AFL98826.1 carbon dioxide concentrating mechanism/carboxysome shell protein [Desulfitobacterium dehalogenans ATCC 51507]